MSYFWLNWWKNKSFLLRISCNLLYLLCRIIVGESWHSWRILVQKINSNKYLNEIKVLCMYFFTKCFLIDYFEILLRGLDSNLNRGKLKVIPLGRPKVSILIILNLWQVSLKTKWICLAGSPTSLVGSSQIWHVPHYYCNFLAGSSLIWQVLQNLPD